MLNGLRRRTAIDRSAALPSSEEGESADNLAAGPTIFRNFHLRDFRATESWQWLSEVIDGNGGCFGLYGPRGSGKSWLMHRAIAEVEGKGGLGLWFPCPRKYDATDFLLTLTDNLANAVERRFARKKAIVSRLSRLRNYFAIAVTTLLVFALILDGAYGLTSLGKASSHPLNSFAQVYPTWLWILIAIGVFTIAVVSVIVFIYKTAATGSLLSDASTLRERVRFSANTKLTAAFDISGSQSIVPSVSQSRERNLLERPVTVASLVFEFRNFAANIVKQLDKPLLICIDELDKIDNTDEVRSLLRDIKGIFEVGETVFLVSISEEAAASLQIGILQTSGRNELNSSFYAIIALPPLTPGEAEQLLSSRRFGQSTRLACALCLLAAGNRRELVRMADLCAIYARKRRVPLDEYAIVGLLAEESSALLQEIIRSKPEPLSAADDAQVKYEAWTALAPENFATAEAFVSLGVRAIHQFWEPDWANEGWRSVSESWKRLLIRLFVGAKVLPSIHGSSTECFLDNQDIVTSLQKTLIMATHDSSVARLMLRESFGGDLSGGYQSTAPQPR
jgi:KAP family P-loop domain